ncbi:MAG: aspartyl/asparaginyl beta-hydroxylase domain-containing protein [Gammaproteobacteria bacterium]
MKLAKPFIRLPFNFDANQLAKELSALEERNWLPHPSGMAGNEALPLVSRDAGDNDDFDGQMQATAHLDQSQYMRQCMHEIGEVYGRSRLMALAPGAEVTRHVDFNYHWHSRVRIHVPVVTNPDVIFYCGDESVNMTAGSCWIFDSWRHHRVVNGGQHRRTHLVIDTAGSSRFWNTVQAIVEGEIDLPEPLEFDPATDYRVMTERHNSAPVMAPGEMHALVEDLLLDLGNNSNNDSATLHALNSTLRNLVYDWRALWSQFGSTQPGFVHYQKLLQNTVEQLPKQPRALTTASNDIGATPIAMQRIIRAALRPDLL